MTTAPGGPQKTKQAPPLLLRQIIALEGVVCALERKTYERGFAWYRLFRHWSGMRWDDSQGLKPDSLEIRARGVVGTLERTKTSGPGKKILLLPVFVSTDAYLVLPWLLVGLALWKEEPLNFDRDFFLPLPTEDLQGAKHIRARYTDSAGFSSALLRSLHDEQNLALLPGLSGNFWTEHSDRAGLDGWAAALGVRESERGFLGRWAAKSSSDRYVRTACRVVENIQVLAARFARKSLARGPDYFGEEHVLAHFTNYVLTHGWAGQECKRVISNLMLPNFALRPALDHDEVHHCTRGGRNSEGETATEPAGSEKEAEDEEPNENLISPLAAEEISDQDLFVAESAREPDEVVVITSGYVIAISRQGRCRRLHCVEACRFTPGLHYKTFENHGDKLPEAWEVTAVCKHCLPGGAPRPEEAIVSDSDSASSSSSTGGSSAGSPAKRARA